MSILKWLNREIMYAGLAALGATALPVALRPYMPLHPIVNNVYMAMIPWQMYRIGLVAMVVINAYRWQHNLVSRAGSEKIATAAGVRIGTGYAVDASHTQRLESVILERHALPVATCEQGGIPALHHVGGWKRRHVTIPWSEMHGHAGIIGSTRSGKTRGLEVLVTGAIRQQGSNAVVIIDPKGDSDLLIRAAYEASQMGRPFHLVMPAFADHSATLNPLSMCQTPSEVATRIQTMMPGVGTASDPFFVEFPLTMVEAIAHAQHVLQQPWTLEGLRGPLLSSHLQSRLLAEYIDVAYGAGNGTVASLPQAIQATIDRQETDPHLANLVSAKEWSSEHFRRMTANLTPAFRGVVGGHFGRLFSTVPAALGWRAIERTNAVLYIGLSSLMFGGVAHRMGRLLLTDLVGYLAQRYAYTDTHRASPITVVVDEFGAVAFSQAVDALAQGGGAGARFIVSMQSDEDAASALSPLEAARIAANLNTAIYYRQSHTKAAAAASEAFGRGTVHLPRQTRAVTHGGSRTMFRVGVGLEPRDMPLVRPEWLQGLPRGHAYARVQGRLYKVATPLLPPIPQGAVDALGLMPIHIQRGQAHA